MTYREYTNLYAPVVIEDDSSSNDSTCENIGGAMAKGEDAVSASDIIQNLAQNIESTSCCRFNISRANVWDGALRGFRRSSYNPNNEMFVKFSDDAGSFEEAIDTGGQKREFLTILMGILKDRPIFDGPAENKYLTFNTTDTECRFCGCTSKCQLRTVPCFRQLDVFDMHRIWRQGKTL